jgi:GcrA cell cycle regulator
MAKSETGWTDDPEKIQRLRELWARTELSTAEIGRRLGVSKNAVVGKARRLDLPGRPSPIRRDGEPQPIVPRQPRPVRGPTLPPLSELKSDYAQLPPFVAQSVADHPPPPQQSPPAMPKATLPLPHAKACCWPIGEPGRKGFRFCEDAALEGKPYCSDHCWAAYPAMRQELAKPSAEFIKATMYSQAA